MPGIGSARWVNEYVGIPYVWGGRSYSGLDCYGLCKLVYAEQYGFDDLPDWLGDEIDLRGRESEIAKAVCSGNFEELEQPVDGCFAVCYRSKVAYHMGIFIGGGVLHSHRNTGAVFEPVREFTESYGKVVFGEWTP